MMLSLSLSRARSSLDISAQAHARTETHNKSKLYNILFCHNFKKVGTLSHLDMGWFILKIQYSAWVAHSAHSIYVFIPLKLDGGLNENLDIAWSISQFQLRSFEHAPHYPLYLN